MAAVDADPAVLADLAQATRRFSERTLAAVEDIRRAYVHLLTDLDDELRDRRWEMNQARARLAEAERALRSCQANPRCHGAAEQRAVAQCQVELRQAEQRLLRARQAVSIVTRCRERFTAALPGLVDDVRERGRQTVVELNRLGRHLHGYQQVPLPFPAATPRGRAPSRLTAPSVTEPSPAMTPPSLGEGSPSVVSPPGPAPEGGLPVQEVVGFSPADAVRSTAAGFPDDDSSAAEDDEAEDETVEEDGPSVDAGDDPVDDARATRVYGARTRQEVGDQPHDDEDRTT